MCRKINPRTKQIVIKMFVLVIAALFLTWLLEYRHFLNDTSDAWEFVFTRTKVFLYNSLIMLTLLTIIYGIVRKIFTSISISTALILIFGYIHIAKFNFRGTPLLPEDFQLSSQAGALTKFVDFSDIMRLIIAVILVIILGILLDKLSTKWLQKEPRYRIVSRIAIVAIALSAFLVTTDFVRHHGKEREIELPFLSSKFTDWNQTDNYADNGFLLGFLYNTAKLTITAPDGYSKAELATIRDNLTAQESTVIHDLTSASQVDYNLIIILNESFYDPSIIADYYHYTGGDVTPNLHKIQQETLSGYMYSPDYGGGTANIEYEAITGLTNYWLRTVPYTNLLSHVSRVPSLASYLKEQGFNTTTIHPFSGGMYKRDTVLPKLGFDHFHEQKDFSYDEKEGESEYINDRSAYNETLDYMRQTEGKDFISLITMQNHAPYNPHEYGDPNYEVTNAENEAEKNAIETYLMSLHKSDEFLGEFIEKLESYDEKVVVLFYGDHSPGVFMQVHENDDKSVSDLIHLTPYFIYTNYTTFSGNLPTTTPNCLPNTLLNTLQITKPTSFYLLDEICTSEPILSDNYFGEDAPVMNTALSSYQLLTYDLSAGEQYFIK